MNIKDSKKNPNLFQKAFELPLTSLFTHVIKEESEYMEKTLKVPTKDIENNMGQYVENGCTTTVLWLYSKFKIVFMDPKKIRCVWESSNWISN